MRRSRKVRLIVELPEFASIRENPDSAHLLRLWDIYRSYIVHENCLINERMNRMFTVQGFIFAAFGGSIVEFGKSFSAFRNTPDLTPLNFFWPFQLASIPASVARLLSSGSMAVLLATTGIISAFVGWRALRATQLARDLLTARWEGISGKRAEEVGLPGVRGGGSEQAHRLGDSHLWLLPCLFCLFWILVGSPVVIAIFQLWRSIGYAFK